jgi:hypothetical protein
MVIKASDFRGSECVAHTGKKRNACRVMVGNLKKGEHLEDLGLDAGITLQDRQCT